jgi:cytochrome bd-type quinol oxidase subunit 2
MKSVLLLNVALLVLFFGAWCVLDYSVVKSPQFPQNCHDSEWVFIFIPLLTVVANLVAQRKRGLRKSLLTAIVASFAVCVLFLGTLVFPGMCFHLSIGGTL